MSRLLTVEIDEINLPHLALSICQSQRKPGSWRSPADTLTVVSGEEHIIAMRPTDTTPASAYVRRPRKQSTLQSNGQGPVSSTTRGIVPNEGAIFLLNFDSPHRERLALALRFLRYHVFIPEEHGISLRQLNEWA